MVPSIAEKTKPSEGTAAGAAKDTVACDERRWDEQLAGSLDVLEDLYDEITADEKAGRTRPINA